MPDSEGARPPKVVDWAQVWQRLDGVAQLWLLLACVVIPAAHFILHRALFTPIGKTLLGVDKPDQLDKERRDKEATLLKFQESAWKCFAYIALSVVAALALKDEVFWKHTADFWTECTEEIPCEYQAPPKMLLAYAADMAYYTYAIPYCIITETKRKDFWATFSHHVATVGLIGYSFCLGFTKVGVVIMLLHDICDPFLEFAKMTRYAGFDLITNISFATFTVLWIAMRNVYFPYIISSVLFEAWDAIVGKGGSTLFPHWELFSGLLIFLAVLHVYWSYVIIKIAIEALGKGAPDDTREKDGAHED